MQISKLLFALVAATAVAAAPAAMEPRGVSSEEVNALRKFAEFAGLNPDEHVFVSEDGKVESSRELAGYLLTVVGPQEAAHEKRLFGLTIWLLLRGLGGKIGGCSSRCCYSCGGGGSGWCELWIC